MVQKNQKERQEDKAMRDFEYYFDQKGDLKPKIKEDMFMRIL